MLLSLIEKECEKEFMKEPTYFNWYNSPEYVIRINLCDCMRKAGYSEEEIENSKPYISSRINLEGLRFESELLKDYFNSDTSNRLKEMLSSKEIMYGYTLDGLKYLNGSDVAKALTDKPENLMTEKEYNDYLNLPDTLTIYRGCSLEELEEGDGVPMGISWSLNKITAEFFAYRYGGDGMCVVEAVINKNSVRYYSNDRSEEEVIIFSPFTNYIEEPHIVSENVADFDCNKYHQKIEN